jgi:Glycosyltransferase family 87
VFIVFASVLASWWLLRERRDAAAGIVLLFILLKPQEAALVPLALLVLGRFRAFVTWVAGAVVVAAGSLAAIGFGGASEYAARIASVSSHPEVYVSVPDLSAPSLVGGGYAGAVAIAAVVAVAGFGIWAHRDRGLELSLAIALVGSLLATPYLHEPDTVMLVAAAWLYLRSRPPAWAIAFLGLGYLLIDLGQAPGVGWTPLVVLEAVWLGAMAVWRQHPAVQGEASPAPA